MLNLNNNAFENVQIQNAEQVSNLPSLCGEENRQSETSVTDQLRRELTEEYKAECADANLPPDHLHGMTVLQRVFNRNNEKQFNQVILVESITDALAIAGYGYQPVWIDGGMHQLRNEDVKQLKNFTKQIVCIPSIDAIGIRQAKDLAIRLPELNMVWMNDYDMDREPDSPRTHTTLADFINLHPKEEDVTRLMGRAISAMFCWFDDKGIIHTSLERLNHYLWLNDYGTIKSVSSDKPSFVHIKNNIVEHVQADDINAFVEKQMTKSGMTEEMHNRVLQSQILPTSRKTNLWRFEELDFTNHTPDSRIFYFKNCWAEVFKDHIETHPYSELGDRYVWKGRVVNHNFSQIPPMFKITSKDEVTYEVSFPEGMKSKLMQIVFNTCRFYWQKQEELKQELTNDERAMEQRCFASRVAALGYMIDPRKASFAAHLLVFVDYKIGNSKYEKNGRTGKSRLVEAAGQIVGLFKRKGDKTSMNSRFFFGGITDEKGILYIDEYDTEQGIDLLLSNVTGDFVVEKKSETISSIPFERSPKIVIATNSVFTQTGSSYSDRIWYQPVSDYYHKKDDSNNYKEDRSIYDDIGCEHMGFDYSEEDWNLDLNFLLQCQQFSMTLPPNKRKIVVGMDQLNRRALQATTDQDFCDWADVFFSPNAGNLNNILPYQDIYQNFVDYTGKQMVNGDFTRQLKKYCQMSGFVYNPASQFPNQRGPKGERKDGDSVRCRIGGKTVAAVYIQSTTYSAGAPPSPTEGNLPF